MPEKIEIITTIAGAGQPITLTEIAKTLGTTSTSMGTQIKRIKTEGLVDETEKDKYILSDKGDQWLEDQKVRARRLLQSTPAVVGVGTSTGRAVDPDPDPDPGEDVEVEEGGGLPPGAAAAGAPPVKGNTGEGKPLFSEMEAHLTDYDYFYQLGIALGLTENLAGIVTAHVWRGGEYTNLKWIRDAFGEMQVRADIASRWWQAWRTHLNHVTDPALIHQVAVEGREPGGKVNADSGSGEAAPPAKNARTRKEYTHVIRDGAPQYVGEGYGDMTYDDALELSKMQAAALAKSGSAGAPAPQSAADSFNSQLDAVKKLADMIRGDGSGHPKSYMVIPSEDGGEPVIQEIEPGKPMVAPAARVQEAPGRTFIIDENQQLEEIEPGRPYIKVVKQGNTTGGNGVGGVTPPVYFFNPSTNMVEAWDPTKGPIMIGPPKAAESRAPVIQMKGADGELMTLDINTYFQLEDHKEQVRQKRESHEMKLGMAREVRDLVSKGTRAFARMTGEEVEEEYGGGAEEGGAQ